MDIELLEERARIIRLTRSFFDNKNYLELDTPLLSPTLIPETCLEVFKTEYLSPLNSKKNTDKELYLIPSPEIWIKKIISEKKVSVYQICKCFRNCESIGKTHSPEFTMLEYYTMDADYMFSLDITEELFNFLLQNKNLLRFQDKNKLEELKPPFIRLTMEEAFNKFAGFSLKKSIADGTLQKEAVRLGINAPQGTSDADLYNLIFINSVEPNLGQDRPVALLDYPAIVPCLAQLNADGLTRQRWELYMRGLEIANCYSEETCGENVKQYFNVEGKLKTETAKVKHNIDSDYWKIFEKDRFPKCSGVALGMDRLIMAFTGRKTIDAVLPF